MTEKSNLTVSPFPGMNPYLEAPDIWPDFHPCLATMISAMLNTQQLLGAYYARLQRWPELGDTLTDLDEPLQHRFVEIRDAERGHKLITLIEIVSPTNKRPGPDRRAYEAKQEEILSSDANLIELDLLRSGRRLLPYPDLEAAVESLDPAYLVLLNRSALREGTWMDYTLYPIQLPEPLPCIPVPLAGTDPDILLDLQVAANRVYREGPYARALDYTADSDPPLDEAGAKWVDERLRAVGWRG
jgi:hypothetical protein